MLIPTSPPSALCTTPPCTVSYSQNLQYIATVLLLQNCGESRGQVPAESDDERLEIARLTQILRPHVEKIDREWSMTYSRNPTRFRQVDLRVILPGGDVVWIEIDGPNHRGRKNIDRDKQLAILANEERARLLHWPLYRLQDEGPWPLVQCMMSGVQHLGHAGPTRYSTFRAGSLRPR